MIEYYILGGMIILMTLFLTWIVIYSKKKTKDGWSKK